MTDSFKTQQEKREKTELVLANIYNLPSVPKVMKETLDLLDNPETSNANLSHVISKDQALVTKILTIANSPMYGLQRRVATIDFAILVLGFNELRNLVTVLSMTESFKNKTDKYLDQRDFWMHSYLTGTTASRLAEDLEFPNSGEAFVAGFLHDIGISILHRYFHSAFVMITELIKDNNLTWREAELHVLGMTHQQISQYLLERWAFPEALCEAILYHHDPEDAPNHKYLSGLINLSDYLTVDYAPGNFSWDKDMKLDLKLLDILKFRSEEELVQFMGCYEDLIIRQSEIIGFLT